MQGSVVRPDSPEYDAGRLPHNLRFADAARPEALVFCAGAQDVAEVLRFARRHDVGFSVRSGGHCYAGWSSGARMVLDVSRMSTIAFPGRYAEIGPGAPMIGVYAELNHRGATVPGGSCPTVRLSGLALGGGHGVVSRAYGLTCDSLVEAEVVLADGRIVRCDAERDADLFWALRGAGNGGFGVVTSLRMRTHAAVDCTVFRLRWPWRGAAAAVLEWQRWMPGVPDELWSNCHIQAGAGGPSVDAGGVFLGGADGLREQLAKLLDRTDPPTEVRIDSLTHLDAMFGKAGCDTVATCLLQPGQAFTARSHFFAHPLPLPAADELCAHAQRATETPGAGGVVTLTALGGAINRVPPDATAFVHRDELLLAQYYASWPTDAAPALVDARTRWTDDAYAILRPYANGHAYQNYRDPRLPDWRAAYYGANLHRLRRVRAAYDPDGVFGFPQAI